MVTIDDDWVRALDEKLAAGPGSVPDLLVLQYVVTHDGGVADYRYHLVLGPDGDRAFPGNADAADATFRLSAATAESIRSGARSSEEAFLAGELDLEGDTTAIVDAHRRRRDA